MGDNYPAVWADKGIRVGIGRFTKRSEIGRGFIAKREPIGGVVVSNGQINLREHIGHIGGQRR